MQVDSGHFKVVVYSSMMRHNIEAGIGGMQGGSTGLARLLQGRHTGIRDPPCAPERAGLNALLPRKRFTIMDRCGGGEAAGVLLATAAS